MQPFEPVAAPGHAGHAIDAWNNPIPYPVSTVTSSVFAAVSRRSAGIEYRVQANGFDDIVLWIPGATLFNRMIAAGAQP